jgi:sugar phosphate isomerase/epimerase
MRILSLAHLTLPGSDPIRLIDAAAEAGFDHVGIRIVPPTGDTRMSSSLGDMRLRAGILRRLADTGLKVLEIEAFWMSSDFEPAGAERAFAFGAEMGASYAVVSGNDPDRNRFLDRLQATCELAARYRLRVSLEFIPYSEVRTLQDARDCLVAIKQPNAGLLIDALHLSRSGGSPSDVAAIGEELVHYLHLCDAPREAPETTDLMRQEARSNRLYPGHGNLPLRELITAAPRDAPIAIEAPNPGLQDRPPAEQARRARQSLLDLLRP